MRSRRALRAAAVLGRWLTARLESIALRPLFFVLAAATLAFAPAIGGGFYLDDVSLLNDPAFATPSGLLDLLQPSRVRPLTNLTFWANAQLHPSSALGFHLVNLLLHLVAIWFARDALSRLLPEVAALAALIVFALHPLQTEPVAYIFARSTVLCGIFSWAAIAAWARGRHWLAVFGTALALLAKEEAVALPIFFALVPRARQQWRPLAAMFALALATGLRGLLATAQIAGSGAAFGVNASPLDYALAQGYVIVRYLRLLLLPLGLNFDPDLNIHPPLAAMGWIALAAIGFLLFKHRRPAALWFFAALIFLAPTSSFLPIDDLAADRRMYLAAPCFAACAALLIPKLRAVHVLAIGLVLAGLTFARSLTFSSPQSLWRDTVAGSPAKLRPRLQLARAVPPAEAIDALAGLGNGPLVATERGRAYLELGRPADALREFGLALAAEPGDPRFLTNRGTALAALNQSAAAQTDFARALSLDPCLYPALLNLRHLGAPLPGTAQCSFTPQQKAQLGLR